jgi:2-oxoglutarate dehydrogenase E1 component
LGAEQHYRQLQCATQRKHHRNTAADNQKKKPPAHLKFSFKNYDLNARYLHTISITLTTKSMKDFSYITNSHPAYIESLYNDYLANPESVDLEMRKFFDGFDFAVSNGSSNGHAETATAPSAGGGVDFGQLNKEFGVFQLIQAYRKRGHLVSTTNPIRERKDRRAMLDLEYFGLAEADLNSNFAAGKFIGLENAKLADITGHLKKCYTSNAGFEYTYINSPERVEWLVNEIEQHFHKPLPGRQEEVHTGKAEPGGDVREVPPYQICGAEEVFT